MRIKADVMNTFIRLPSPENAPLRGGLGDYHRFKTYPICAKCDKQWPKEYPLILQVPKFVDQGGILVAGPGISDQRVMEEMMVNACNRAVGCWRECLCGRNWRTQCVANCVIRGDTDASGMGPARVGDCKCICACIPGCGNQKRYPCRCSVRHSGTRQPIRYVDIFHNKGCPVADFKRDSSFVTALVRQRLGLSGRRACL